MSVESTQSNHAALAIKKLDGLWFIHLFFKTWPYYVRRANYRTDVPYEQFDVVISEHLPRPKLSKEANDALDFYTMQLWAMILVYAEAILEHYLLAVIEELGISKKRLPRQAEKMYDYIRDLCMEKYGVDVSVPKEMELQLGELNATRHLWVHLDGKVDQQYLKKTEDWWKTRPSHWFEKVPTLNTRRELSELYVKFAIHFARQFVMKIDADLVDANILGSCSG